jgi:hypothetical protein
VLSAMARHGEVLEHGLVGQAGLGA